MKKWSYFFVLIFFQSCVPLSVVKHSSTPNSATSSGKDEPSLEDLFSGKASFQSVAESEEIVLQFSDTVIGIWDQKLSVFFNPNDKMYYTLTRGALTSSRFNIFLFKSSDGVHFQQVGGALFDSLSGDRTYYDSHLTQDTSVTPTRYIISMECASLSGAFGASLCTSFSTAPWDPTSWSTPKLIIENNGLLSASTGVSLVDNGHTYLKWSLVNDGGVSPAPGGEVADEGNESTSSWFVEISNLTNYVGKSGIVGHLMIGAKENVYCNSSWDCNNVDVQDWKKVGHYFYAIYNGANYFRCVRPIEDSTFLSTWSIGIRRSSTALGSYDESSGPIINAPRSDTCGISYPVLNQVNNETYLYYAYYLLGNGGNKMMRSKLIWKASPIATLSPAPSTPIFPAPSYHPSLLIKRFYKILLLRIPSSIEITNWENYVQQTAINKSKNLALQFLNSTEFQNRWVLMTPNEKAKVMYQGFLFRIPSSTEENGFATFISGLTNTQVYDAILDSQEFSNISLSVGGI
ncbi:MAG: hypothetical protein PHY93_17700 [Bacteriovorax sp.]|nr:hypothetical protein [Bacteriovorax sp.]